MKRDDDAVRIASVRPGEWGVESLPGKSVSVDADGMFTGRDEEPREKHTQIMNHKTPKEVLLEIISGASPDEQQSLRDALKTERLTPQLAELIAAQIAATKTAAPTVVPDPKVGAKLDEILALAKELNGKPAQPAALDRVAKTTGETLEKVDAVRLDLRGIADDVATLRPYHRMKLATALILVFALGAAAGWYGRIGYRNHQRTHWEGR